MQGVGDCLEAVQFPSTVPMRGVHGGRGFEAKKSNAANQ